MNPFEEAAIMLARARRVAVLTGAGVSAESGVPTFRGEQGLWRQYRPEELANPQAFARDPKLVWEWYTWRQEKIADCEPNAGHRALVELEKLWPRVVIITQNIDGLHDRAGSRNVLELHGNIWQVRCVQEETVSAFQKSADLPPHCQCGALLRPHIVWFGEALDHDVHTRAMMETEACNVFLLIGTSALVSPANRLSYLAGASGATVVEINPERTVASNSASLCLRGPSAELLPKLVERARTLKK